MVGGFTPLMSAAALGSFEIVALLMKYGADVFQEADDGRLANNFAASAGHEKLATILSV